MVQKRRQRLSANDFDLSEKRERPICFRIGKDMIGNKVGAGIVKIMRQLDCSMTDAIKWAIIQAAEILENGQEGGD